MTATMIPVKTDFLSRLRSGEYAQAPLTLCSEDGYCALGVAMLSLGYEFVPSENDPDDYGYIDIYDGEFNCTLPHAGDMETLGLDEIIPIEKANEIRNRYGVPAYFAGDEITTGEVIVGLSDNDVSFEDIADLIETEGWM